MRRTMIRAAGARYAQAVSEELDALLRAASEADGMHRIDCRDPIAAHGAEAVRRLEPWLRDDRLARFAVVTIVAAASRGATSEARAVLQRAQSSDASLREAIASALTALRVGTGRTRAQPGKGPAGSPDGARDELRAFVEAWRKRGRPAQRAIRWRQPDWMAAFPAHREQLARLPAALDRAAVRRVAADAVHGPAEAEFAFVVVKAWGEGDNGYGPSRALESLELTEEPGRRLMTVAQRLRDRGALAAYALLSDGGECRIFNLGPAFGTKYLHFCQPESQRPQALIHDKNVADWLHDHAGFARASTSWSPPRYSAYLTQMHAWAADLACQPEDLELCMFLSALPPTNQWSER